MWQKRIVVALLLIAAILLLCWFNWRQESNATTRQEREITTRSASRQRPSLVQTNGPTTSTGFISPAVTNAASLTNTSRGAGLTNANSQSAAAIPAQLSPGVLRQIAALQADKALRTPVQQKIDSQLLYADKMRRGLPVADGIATLRVDLDQDAQGRVEVDVTANVTDQLLAHIANLGGKTVNSFTQYQAIRAWIPLAQVESLARRGEVKFIQPAIKAVTNTGSVVSEGDSTHRAGTARSAFNVTGAGVKVGVLSDSVDYLSHSQALGDLGTVTILPNQAGTGKGEGTAMLEIVHDLAPSAQLFFSTGFGGPAQFAQNIHDLRFVNHCDIIVDDLEYSNESPFQDAIVAQAVNEVTADGALYFSSASNSGNKDDNTSSTWEGDFVDGGITGLESGRIHNFGSAAYNTVASGGSQRHVDLFWSDPLGAATNDYDVYVLDSTGSTVVASSTIAQTGTQDPYEHVGKVDAGQRIVIVKFVGSSRFLHLEAGRGYLTTSTVGRTKGHSAAIDAFSVAAVNVAKASYPNPFVVGAKNPVETFSSDGPRRVFYFADGTPVTPGNFSSSGGIIRQKPDIAAADGVTTTLPLNGGLNPFFGTSAAAPHAAAIAALLKSYNPSLTSAQIRAALTGTALEIEAPGVDRDSGYGIIMADAALQAVSAPSLPTVTSFSPSSGNVGGAVIITGTKFSGVMSVKFNGTSATFTVNSATQITASVPAGATTGTITVTTSGGTATSAGSFTVAATPVITSFSPTSGAAGSSVTINGVNFTGVTSVKFNGISAGYTVNSSIKITASIPASATTGRITVTTTSGAATSTSNFTVTALPIVSGFSPSSGGIGATIVVTGANFSTATNAAFNGVSASGTINSDTQLTLTVPVGATTGPITVRSPAGLGTSAANFTVLPAPTVISFSPSSGPIGTLVTINGSNFSNATTVTFSGTSASFTVASSSQITATVPLGATAGTIAVRTAGGTGTSSSSFTVITPPANNNFTSAQTVSGNLGTVTGNNIAATKETGEPNHAGNTGGKSIWYRWTAPSSGAWRFDTSGSSFDTVMAVYTGTSLINLTVIASDDDTTNGVTSSVTFLANSGTVYWIAVDGYNSSSSGVSSAASGTVTLNWSLLANAPVISGFSPSSGVVGSSVTVNGANFTSPLYIYFNGTPASGTFFPTSISVAVPAGATAGPISVTTPGGTAESLADFVVLNPPANDNFANAQVLSDNSGSVTGSNVDATKETGEPNHAGNPGGKSVWYRWIAPSSGGYVFDTRGSGIDSELAVYTGTALSSLTLIASNDDSGVEITSAVAFTAVGGQEYRIAVDANSGSSGNLMLNWRFVGNAPVITAFTPSGGGVYSIVTIAGLNFSNVSGVGFNGINSPSFQVDSSQQVRALVSPGATNGPITVICGTGTATSTSNFRVTDTPFNDDFSSAFPLSGSLNILTLNNLKATFEEGEPNHGGVPGGKSRWFRWTAPSNGVYTFDTAGSGFDTTLAVYTGTSITNLSLVASNDDAYGYTFSSVTFTAVANTTYRIAVDGYGGAGGDFVLRYQPTLSPVTVYNSTFGPGQGYSTSGTLAGQQGWLQTGTGGNGIVTDFFPDSTQQAYIGYSAGNNLQLERPFNYTPDLVNRPTVRFSVRMRIYDSTNFRYDDFRFRFFNQSGHRFFTVNFDNTDLSVNYTLDDAGLITRYSNATFDNYTIYTLSVVMNFAGNSWSAWLDDQIIAADQPITTSGQILNLRSVAVSWVQSNVAFPGDNYLVFDDYTVTAEAALAASIVGLSSSKTVTAGTTTSLAVLAGGTVPFAYQWRHNGVDISGETNAVINLPSVSLADSGGYSVVIGNTYGTVTSEDAVLTVNAPPASLVLPRFATGSQFQFELSGVPGQICTIFATTNLIDWSPLFSVTNATGHLQVVDPNVNSSPRRFYRAANGLVP